MLKQTVKMMSDYNIIQRGEFKLKNGETSNIYVNLKNIISYPDLLSNICILLKDKILKSELDNFVLCGVPYGAIPIATGLSLSMGVGQILLRKEKKEYGTKKLIEGNPNTNNVILIEDVITTGSSVKETIKILENNNYNVIKTFCVVNRSSDNYNSIFKLNDLLDFKDDIEMSPYYLAELRIRQKPSIIWAYDDSDVNKLWDILPQIAKYISGLKIHSEILNLTQDENIKLYKYCVANNIFLWEDRKFNDISNTVQKQIKYYENIRDYISVVPTSGSDILNIKSKLGKFVLCEMSSRNNLFNNITRAEIQNKLDNGYNICGVICQNPELFAKYSTIMPGINLNQSTDNSGQQWRNPTNLKYKPNYYVVGRYITLADNPVERVKQLLSSF